MPLDQDAHELLGLLAYIHLEHNRPEKSVILLQTLHAIGLATSREQTMLALALLRVGKPDIAMTRLDELALHGTVDAPYHLVRSQTLHALNRKAEARSAMQAYLRLRGIAASENADSDHSQLKPATPRPL